MGAKLVSKTNAREGVKVQVLFQTLKPIDEMAYILVLETSVLIRHKRSSRLSATSPYVVIGSQNRLKICCP